MTTPLDFEHGHCHVFALALHRLTNLPIKAALVECLQGVGPVVDCLVHAWVEPAPGLVLHCRGTEDIAFVLDHYPDGDQARVVAITEAELIRLGEGDHAQGLAARLDEALPLARLVASPLPEIARRRDAIHTGIATEAAKRKALTELAHSVEEVFRELSDPLVAALEALRESSEATQATAATGQS